MSMPYEIVNGRRVYADYSAIANMIARAMVAESEKRAKLYSNGSQRALLPHSPYRRISLL